MDEERLLRAMGFEAANIHHGAKPAAVAAIRADLASRGGDWLKAATGLMEVRLDRDWKDWREGQSSKPA
jgi:hypothetical protein